MQGMALLLGLLASVHATAPQVWMPPDGGRAAAPIYTCTQDICIYI